MDFLSLSLNLEALKKNTLNPEKNSSASAKSAASQEALFENHYDDMTDTFARQTGNDNQAENEISKQDFLNMYLPNLDEVDREALFDYLTNGRGYITQTDIDDLTPSVTERFPAQGSTVQAKATGVTDEAAKGSEIDDKAETSNAVGEANQSSSGNAGGIDWSAKEEALKHMGKEELNNELVTANSELADKKTKLEGLEDGTDPQLADLKKTMEGTQASYNEQLKAVVSKEGVVQSLKNNISKKREQISKKNGEIKTQEGIISSTEALYNAAVSAKTIAEAGLARANGMPSENPIQRAAKAIATNIARSAVNAAKAVETALKTKLDEAKAKLEKLKRQKNTLTNELKSLSAKKEKAESELETLRSELEEKKKACDEAKQAHDDYKTTAIQDIDKYIKALESYIVKIQEAIANLNASEETDEDDSKQESLTLDPVENDELQPIIPEDEQVIS